MPLSSVIASPTWPTQNPVNTVEFTVATETVGDKVDYTPNLADGGFAAPQQQARFQATQISATWTVNEKHRVESTLTKRQFTSLRDKFGLQRLELISRHTLEGSGNKHRNILEFGFATNFSESIYKNSYTTLGDATIRSLTINNPSDRVIHSGITHTRFVTDNSSISLSSSLGHIRSGNSGVNGKITTGSCQYNFNFDHNGGEIAQPGPCGDIRSLTRRYPTDETIETELGISPVNDTQYSALFLKLGGQYNVIRGKWTAGLAFYHQQYDRGHLDQRISSRFGTPYRNNQVAWAELRHTTTPRLAFSAKLEYNRRQFLDTVPVLYSGVTSHRFKSDVMYLSLRLHYRL